MVRETAKLAIPVFRLRVAPVLNWCSKMLILGEDALTRATGQEILLLNMDAFDRLRILKDEGIDTLICGALTPDLLTYGRHLGLHIICGVAGDVDQVLSAYQEDQLDQPRFWLPGCAGQRDYRKGCIRTTCARRDGCEQPSVLKAQDPEQKRPLGEQARGEGRHAQTGSQSKAKGGPGGLCLCPQCGFRIRHERGVPCAQMVCPQCDLPMTRK
jgi:predicted Fe-Mo cluster-binding NifX family protein